MFPTEPPAKVWPADPNNLSGGGAYLEEAEIINVGMPSSKITPVGLTMTNIPLCTNSSDSKNCIPESAVVEGSMMMSTLIIDDGVPTTSGEACNTETIFNEDVNISLQPDTIQTSSTNNNSWVTTTTTDPASSLLDRNDDDHLPNFTELPTTTTSECLDLELLFDSLAFRRRGTECVSWWHHLSLEEVDQLLETEGVTLPPFRTILHRSIFEKDYYLIGLILLSKYRDLLNEVDAFGRTPLHVALMNADVIATQLLLSCPIYHPDSRDPDSSLSFIDVCTPFAQIPVVHLPLAAAIGSDNLGAVAQVYQLLLGYTSLTIQLREGRHPPELQQNVFSIACGWYSILQHNHENTKEEIKEKDNEHPKSASTLETIYSLFIEFLETRHIPPSSLWCIDAVDRLGYSALHRVSSMGLTSIAELLLDTGADPLIKDCYGDLPIHHAIDSGDEAIFGLLLQRGGSLSSAGDSTGCDPLTEDTSIMTLFKRCILRGSWKSLGRLIMDEVYSQFPVSELDFDHLTEFASLCGFSKEFAAAFNMAVDGVLPLDNGPNHMDSPPYTSRVKIFSHEDCLDHLPFPHGLNTSSIKRARLYIKYPENPSRLLCLVPELCGVLRSSLLSNVMFQTSFPPASIADILRVHEWGYIRRILGKTHQVEMEAESLCNPHPYAIEEIDGDTPITPGSWKAACSAAGAVIAAVNAVCTGDTRSAFCAIRPPGHHVGTWGPCQLPSQEGSWESAEEDWLLGSQGFCLINNIAIGAAYARYRYGPEGIRRIAIVDFDVHHGNGTEQIIKSLSPRTRHLTLPTSRPGDLNFTFHYTHELWKPWWSESDGEEIFFASIHGFSEGFYPGTGGSNNPAYPNIHNVPLCRGTSQQTFRTEFVERIINPLAEFQPDILFLSAGFDGHSMDLVADAFGGCFEADYEWITRLLVALANDYCEGRIVSVLEGGYNSKAGTLSPLALSVIAHVRVLQECSFVLSLPSAKLLPASLVLADEDIPSSLQKRRLWEASVESEDNGRTVPKRRKRAAAVKALAQIEERRQQQQQLKQCWLATDTLSDATLLIKDKNAPTIENSSSSTSLESIVQQALSSSETTMNVLNPVVFPNEQQKDPQAIISLET